MLVRRSRRGFFLGCAQYPQCKGTQQPDEATLAKITEVIGADEERQKPDDGTKEDGDSGHAWRRRVGRRAICRPRAMA